MKIIGYGRDGTTQTMDLERCSEETLRSMCSLGSFCFISDKQKAVESFLINITDVMKYMESRRPQ